jgi:hypothetical protein
MGRPRESAPSGYFSLADAARIVGIDYHRANFYCSEWGANLIKPVHDPHEQGHPKWLSEQDLVKLALIPKLIGLGVPHETTAKLFKRPTPAFDLPQPQGGGRMLEWLILLNHDRWEDPLILTSGYDNQDLPGSGAWHSLRELLRKGGPSAVHIIKLEDLKRRLRRRV